MRCSLLLIIIFYALPASAQNGTLRISVSQSGIEINVGNSGSIIASTSTPVEFRLPPGMYKIIARKAGFIDLVQTATVRSGILTTVNIKLSSSHPQERQLHGEEARLLNAKVGSLKILSAPSNALVLINDQERRLRTPMEITGLPIGYYKVSTAGCEILAPVRENIITRVECIDGVLSESYVEAFKDIRAEIVPSPDSEVPLKEVNDRFAAPLGNPGINDRIETGNQIVSNNRGEGATYLNSTNRGRKGIEIGLGIGALIATGSGITETGFAVHGSLAYGISERFAIGWSGAAASINDTDADDGKAFAAVGGLFGRAYFLAAQKSIRPYLTLGIGQGFYQIDVSRESLNASGLSGMAGVGLDYVRMGALGLYLEFNYNVVNFDKIKLPGGAGSASIDINIDYVVVATGLRFRF